MHASPSLSPEARSRPVSAAYWVHDGGAGWVGVVYPLVMPRGHDQGVHHPPIPTRTAVMHPVAALTRTRTGLWAQGGSQGPGEGGSQQLRCLALLYLRPFPPGQPIRQNAGLADGWIGPRSSPPQGGLGVQDLVGLSLGCSSPAIRPDGDGTGRDVTGRNGTGRN